MFLLAGIILVWVVAVMLALLGTMREVVVLQGRVEGLTELLLKPPGPSFPGGVLPDLVSDHVQRAALARNGDIFPNFPEKRLLWL